MLWLHTVCHIFHFFLNFTNFVTSQLVYIFFASAGFFILIFRLSKLFFTVSIFSAIPQKILSILKIVNYSFISNYPVLSFH